MKSLDALINDWAEETREEGWWVGMEYDLARLVRRAYQLGVQHALAQSYRANPLTARAQDKALCDAALRWEDGLRRDGAVAPERSRGIHRAMEEEPGRCP